MKKIVIIPIVLGIALVAAGTAITIYAATQLKDNAGLAHITNTHDVEESFDNIEGSFSTADFDIKLASDGKVKVECEEKEKQYHEVKVEDNTLKIKLIDERKWYQRWFDWDFRSLKVTLYVPEKAYDNFEVTNSTGHINVESHVSFSKMTAKTSTGSVTIKSNVTGEVKVKTSTGSINLENITTGNVNTESSTGSSNFNKVTVLGDVYTKLSTGSFKFNDSTCENLTSNASTGSAKINNSIVNNHMEIKRSTGSVDFYNADANSVKVKTDTGHVKGNFLTDKVIYAKSDTGSISVPHLSSGGLCEIETDTGSIKIEIGAK